MTKQELFEAFEGRISKSAIRKADDEYRVVGKFCYVAPQDGLWDIWICNPRNLTAGLGSRKVNNLCQAIFEPDKYTLLDGEAHGLVRGA